MTTRVAVTGIGVVSAFGVGVEAFWRGLLAGRGGLGAGRRVLTPGGVLVGESDLGEPRAFAQTPQSRRIDRTSLLALAASRLALADAGLAPGVLDPARTGLGLASAAGNVEETATFLDRLAERGTGTPLLFPNLVMNAPLSYVSIELGVTGPGAMLSEHEASGEAAVAWGARLVADDAVDVCLAGASDEITTGLLRLRTETRTLGRGAPRPLDLAADGPALGEGAAVVVLESPSAAARRHARVYARLALHDGFGIPAPVHGWPADGRAMASGLADLAADTDLVVAAASGCPALDAFEADALARAVGTRRVPVTAPRGATGDFGAAGALAIAAAALGIHHGLVPPTPGCRLPARHDLDVVVDAPRRAAPRTALVDGVARGGLCRPVRLEAP
jgi:3-oxoacyl-(acyl-carrier-protein) synthase